MLGHVVICPKMQGGKRLGSRRLLCGSVESSPIHSAAQTLRACACRVHIVDESMDAPRPVAVSAAQRVTRSPSTMPQAISECTWRTRQCTHRYAYLAVTPWVIETKRSSIATEVVYGVIAASAFQQNIRLMPLYLPLFVRE